jgi:hypothetical protein
LDASNVLVIDHQVQVSPNQPEPVLALAVHPDNSAFYVSLPSGVYHLTTPTATSARLPQLPPPPLPEVTFTSLHVIADNDIVAGTLAHGIWRYDGRQWQQDYVPPALDPAVGAGVALDTGQVALVGFNWPRQQDCQITTPGNILIETVAQPAFPLQPRLLSPSGSFPLTAGSVILAIKNNRTNSKAELQVVGNPQLGTITVTIISEEPLL